MSNRDMTQQQHWDNVYDDTKNFFGQQPSRLGLSALPVLKKNDVIEVLELGCGQGRDTWFFAKNGLRVTALDYSESGVCQMQDKAKEKQMEDIITAKIHDAREPLPFPDNSFDAIFSHMFFTMELTEEEAAKILHECRRVLRSGGLNIYSVRNNHDPHYGKFEKMGKDMWKNPGGFVVHFYNEETLRQLSADYDVLWIKEFDEPTNTYTRKLYEVVLRNLK
ncbi:MAG: class I SAM-dependent methyltransferase [Euryarchaeota archaeon]|nr:class I SAM-dependent methyltransferase [Euryarchaeota archaeon]